MVSSFRGRSGDKGAGELKLKEGTGTGESFQAAANDGQARAFYWAVAVPAACYFWADWSGLKHPESSLC